MFKNLTAFRISSHWFPSVEQLRPNIEKHRFVPCGATQIQSMGWIPPRGEKHGELIESIGGHLMLTLCIQTKMLPASVVREELEAHLDRLERSQGRRPGKKEQRDIKAQVVLELLPKAFTKKEQITIWIDRRNRVIALDTTSNTKTDVVTSMLVKTIDDLALKSIQTAISPNTAMKNWLLSGQAPDRLATGRECELKSVDECRSAVKYTRHALDIEEIRAHLHCGKSPTKLSMTWAGQIAFELTEAMTLKKISFLETPMMKTTAKGGDDPFDTNVAIATGELSQLIPELIMALGGEVEATDASKDEAAAASKTEAQLQAEPA